MWHDQKRGPTAAGIWISPAGGPKQGNLGASGMSPPITLEFRDGTLDSKKNKTMPCQPGLDKPSNAAPPGDKVRPHLDG